MKLMTDNKSLLKRLVALGAPALIAAPISVHAQAIEWEPDEGYHEEEWYDPSDWFDDDTSIDYETDYGDYYYYGPFWDSVTWYETYDYTDDEADVKYGMHYEWNPDTNQWEQDYGPYLDSYSYTVQFDEEAAGLGSEQGQQQQQNQQQTTQQQQQQRGQQQTAQQQQQQRNQQQMAQQNRQTAQQDRQTAQQDRKQQQDRQQQQGRQQSQGEGRETASAKQEWTTQSQKQSQSAQQNSMKTLSGTIEGFRKVDLRYPAGSEQTHSLARVSLEKGQSAVIDLGYASLVDADLQQGDQVTLRGSDGTINGQRVFVVTELETADGETVFIDRAVALQQSAQQQSAQQDKRSAKRQRDSKAQQERSGQSRQMAQQQQGQRKSQAKQQQQKQQQTAQQVTLEGQLEDHTTVTINGENESKTLVKLRLQNGDAATIDLGPNTSLSDLDLQQGDQIRVSGQMKQIQNRNVLAAQSISVEGEKIKSGS